MKEQMEEVLKQLEKAEKLATTELRMLRQKIRKLKELIKWSEEL
jgi:hypothetical protein